MPCVACSADILSTDLTCCHLVTSMSLPTELLVRIFELLPLSHLLSCRIVSKQFDQVIKDSNSLRYLIELGSAAYVDDEHALSTSKSLALLKAHEEACRTCQSSSLTVVVSLPYAEAHFLSLRDGTPHPRAPAPRLRLAISHACRPACLTGVMDDLLVVSVVDTIGSMEVLEIITVKWDSGEVKSRIQSSPSDRMRATCCIPNNCLLVAVDRSSRSPPTCPCILVYHITSESPILIATYELPSPRVVPRDFYLAFTFNDPQKWNRHKSFAGDQSQPFFTPATNSVIVLSFSYRSSPMFSIVSLVSTFLSPVSNKTKGPEHTIPWPSWGPSSTRWFDDEPWRLASTAGDCHTFGYRVAFLDRVLDFNPRKIARDSQVHQTSVIRGSTVVEGGIVSTLPYRETLFPKLPFDNVILGGDHFVGVQVSCKGMISKRCTWQYPELHRLESMVIYLVFLRYTAT
ncbi:hypothetical protein JAAARDRAFT_73074 [Jaapia argillacea MUCL 33604]|uniref:F-box domain-containing protein n=1 Tax=Jaapia argillacea MUCL 33604 TaxID=933084 RepID=A0A067PCW1_9AGAM|nr:hypothetical protein JAAARDRAFT_73074 [Jaapia argillacea MUCL 33604]